jgi:hypothetical protein
MASRTITVRLSRRRVLTIIRKAIDAVTGQGPQSAPVRALQVRVGLTVLNKIREAFIQKAQGGADDSGLTWPPLSPFTIAYKRRHREIGRRGQVTNRWLPRSSQRASYAPSYALTPQQRDQWWRLYYNGLHKGMGRSHSAAAAWLIVKADGARTLMDLYGNAQVEILRDTGALLRSLTPGGVPDGEATSPPRTRLQIFRLERGQIVLGTERPWAETHHQGVPGRIPQRRLWPEPSAWPAAWWKGILEQAALGFIKVVEYMLAQASS